MPNNHNVGPLLPKQNSVDGLINQINLRFGSFLTQANGIYYLP
jgi:hypothetical protein